MQLKGPRQTLAVANKLKKPPACPSFPLLGSLPFIGMGKAAGFGPPPHVQMARLAEIYGDVMELQMGQERWIVLSSPQAVHEAFVQKALDFSGRPMVPSMSISSGGGQGFAQPQLTPELKHLRRVAFGSLFDAAQVRQAHVELENEALHLSDHLVTETSRRGGVELRPALRHAIMNCVLSYAFSARVPFPSESKLSTSAMSTSPIFGDLVEIVDEIWSELTSTKTTVSDLLAPPALAKAFATYSTPLDRLVKRRDTLLRTIVAQRRLQRKSSHAKDGNSQQDMLDALLDAGLPESDVLYVLVDLFVAGVNTVSSQLEWLFLLTAKETSVQERARANLRHSRNEDYTQALINEVLRTKPPLLLPRRAIVDSSIGGYAVPAGRIILANNWALTHANDWWDKPEAFRPERWLEEERQLEGVDACKFIPFSIGRRVCPGSRLADAEMSVFTRVLLDSCSWKPVEGLIDLDEEYSLTLVPKKIQSLRFEQVES